MNAKVSRFALSGIAIFALAFGLLTLYSGGQVIFGGAAALISRIIYILVALAAVWCISFLFRRNAMGTTADI